MVLGIGILDKSKSRNLYHCNERKPDIVRERIVQLIGDIPRIELFAREQSNGWVCVGNEVDGMDIRDSLKQIAEL